MMHDSPWCLRRRPLGLAACLAALGVGCGGGEPTSSDSSSGGVNLSTTHVTTTAGNTGSSVPGSGMARGGTSGSQAIGTGGTVNSAAGGSVNRTGESGVGGAVQSGSTLLGGAGASINAQGGDRAQGGRQTSEGRSGSSGVANTVVSNAGSVNAGGGRTSTRGNGGSSGLSSTGVGGTTRFSGGTAGNRNPSSNAGSAGTNCPASGHVTYTLTKIANPSQAEQSAYDLITQAMDKAVAYYNCYTNITKSLRVSYVTSVQTADGNINGSIRFGASTTYMNCPTSMHEIAHTVGIGTASNWGSFISDGLFTGARAAAELKAINATLQTPLYTELHADTQHFWPYGLNKQDEGKTEAELLNHLRMVVAIRADLGLE